MRTAFSTVACPEWTLEDVAAFAGEAGFGGVELRTFGHDSTHMACDPSLTAPAKVRDLFEDAGVRAISIASSVRYDAPVFPPVLGHALQDRDESAARTKSVVGIAAQCEIPAVRVFPFELPRGERHTPGFRRIARRLAKALAVARNTGVCITLENAGSFPTATDLLEFANELDHPLFRVAYAPYVAAAHGEDPHEGLGRLIDALGDRVSHLKLTDTLDGVPVRLGQGERDIESLVGTAIRSEFSGWYVVEHPRLWIDGLEDPHDLLRDAASTLGGWLASTSAYATARA